MAEINQQAIDAERQRLYESASLRDDLDDSEASTLLKWGRTGQAPRRRIPR